MVAVWFWCFSGRDCLTDSECLRPAAWKRLKAFVMLSIWAPPMSTLPCSAGILLLKHAWITDFPWFPLQVSTDKGNHFRHGELSAPDVTGHASHVLSHNVLILILILVPNSFIFTSSMARSPVRSVLVPSRGPYKHVYIYIHSTKRDNCAIYSQSTGNLLKVRGFDHFRPLENVVQHHQAGELVPGWI